MPKWKFDERKVYRLALYGVRSSGKTCILSALSLPRVPHPEGYSCTWIENVPGHPLPAGEPESWTTDDPYHVGWKWLHEQRERLKRGDRPAPNPNRADAMWYRFDFGSTDHGTRHIELIDYSGELVTASASELAKKLREHMRDCDGLLVLAEVPYPGRDDALLVEDLEKLSRAFQELLNEREDSPQQDWPIALLFSKWDRRCTTKENGHGDTAQLLEKFLDRNPAPPHTSVRDTVRNAVGNDNTRCFLVSAFGEHEIRDNGAEVPRLKDGRLQSFALEDGFLWVADRVESLQVERIEQAARATSWWAFPQIVLGTSGGVLSAETSAWKRWFRGVSASSAISSAWRLRRQFPKHTKLRSRTTSVLKLLGAKLASQVAVFLVFLVVLVIGTETLIDGIAYRDTLATHDDPAATVEDLQDAEAWLESYFTSPSFRHTVSSKTILDRSDAHRLLVEFRTRRDQSLWKTVDDAEDPQTRLILARKYLDAFRSGLHRSEAETLIADADRQKWELKNREYLEQVAIRIDAVDPGPDTSLDSLHSLSQEVDRLPFPEARSQANEQKQTALRSRIAEMQAQIVEATRQAEWERFKQTYLALMQSGSVAEAAKALVGRKPEEQQLAKLRQDFASRAPAIIRDRVQSDVKNRSWELARVKANLVADPNIVTLLPADEVRELQGLQREISEAEDRDLYAQVVRYKPHCSDQLNAYLTRAPLKSMEAEARKYQKYVDSMKQPMKLTLTLTALDWHEDYEGRVYSYTNDVAVRCKGEPLIAASGIKSEPNTTSADVGTGAITAGLNDTITIDVSIVAKYGVVWTSRMSGGAGSWTGTPNELCSGVTIDVNGKGFTNKATFSVKGIPTEPALPPWTPR